MRRAFVLIMFLLGATSSHAQGLSLDSLFVLPDSARAFTLEHLYHVVLQHHPVARQAGLLPEVARQEIRLAKGAFDPKLEMSYLLKHYEGTEYYRLFDGSIKFPTQSPITPALGVERNTGEQLNPEHYISPPYDYRQLYAGVSLPLGQGLFTDERRTAIRQAELFQDLMAAEQIKVLNKLLLDVAKDYWEWYYTYYNYRLATRTINVAGEIFRRVKMNYLGGESAVIDTVQARITLLERLVNQQESLQAFRNATLKLSTYLWDSLQNPAVLPANYAPAEPTSMIAVSPADLEELVHLAEANHPDLQKINLKIRQLELDNRLAREFLKPRLDVSYYFLNQPFNAEGSTNAVSVQDNFKLGIDVAFPLFLRKERAKVAAQRIKLSNADYDRRLINRAIVNEIRTAHNDLVTGRNVLQQQQQMADHYMRLVQAELLNLENGESDLFKINVQQEKLFQAQSKLIKVIAQYEKQKSILYWSAGVRPLGSNQ